MSSNTIYKPYTYLIGWTRHDKWYYGVRYAQKNRKKNCLYETGCHPDDLWKTYFTSSKIVHEFVEIHGQPDIIQVRKTFDDPAKAQNWERKVLLKLNTKFSNKWLNYGCYMSGVIMHSEETKKKMSESSKGVKTKEHALAISKGRKGIKFTQEHIENIRKAATGVRQPQETKEKRKKTMSKLKWWNDGKINKRSEICPGTNWTRGRIKGFTWKKNNL